MSHILAEPLGAVHNSPCSLPTTATVEAQETVKVGGQGGAGLERM